LAFKGEHIFKHVVSLVVAIKIAGTLGTSAGNKDEKTDGLS
jgi:hypothetical protein